MDSSIAEDHTPKQLKPFAFKAGVSGNPNGRPKGVLTAAAYFRDWLSHIETDGRSRLDLVADKLFESRPEIILAYAYGKPVELTLDLTPESNHAELYKAVARALLNGPSPLSGEQIKTPVIES